MTSDKLAKFIDLTLLRPDATRSDVETIIHDAFRYPFASLCIPPYYVEMAAEQLKDSTIKVGTVVGFPLGCQMPHAKLLEAREAVEKGAEEIDIVMNISAFKSGAITVVEDEISKIVSSLPGIVTKVIIETCYLSDEEKRGSCETIIRCNADFVKTSTGFGPTGATVKDIRLLKDVARGRIRIKASGGIKTLTETLEMIDAGAKRVGTSSGIRILREFGTEKE